MRLLVACAVSVALHAFLLTLPAGDFVSSLGGEGSMDGLAMKKTSIRTRLNQVAHVIKNKDRSVRLAPQVPAETIESDDAATHAPLSSPGVPSPHYYGPEELSRRAKAIGDIAAPPDLERSPVAGRLILVLLISATGVVDGASIADSSLDESTTDTLKTQFEKLRFHPAEIDGVAVNSKMKIEVLIRPPGP